MISTARRRTIGAEGRIFGSMPLIRVSFLIVAGLIGLSAPAHAADLATIGCAEDKLDAPMQEKIAGEVAQNLHTTGQKHVYSPQVLGAIKQAVLACANEHHWPTSAEKPVMLYTLARLAYPVARRMVDDRGLDSGALEAAWYMLPPDTREKPMTPEVNRQLSEATKDSPDQSPEAAELVGEFFGYLNIMEYCSYDFSQA